MCLSILICFTLALGLNEISWQQDKVKTDTIYYVLDTLKTPKNERMWSVELENQAKVYTILCPCLEHGRNPTFFYPLDNQGQVIKKKELRLMKLTGIADLIQKAKQFTNKGFIGKLTIFLIEPLGKGYVIHKVGMVPPRKTTTLALVGVITNKRHVNAYPN